MNNNFIEGFVKRAKEYGLNHEHALSIYKQAAAPVMMGATGQSMTQPNYPQGQPQQMPQGVPTPQGQPQQPQQAQQQPQGQQMMPPSKGPGQIVPQAINQSIKPQIPLGGAVPPPPQQDQNIQSLIQNLLLKQP